ncbi:MAG: ribose-phosphate diphosphokinase [Treponema sp.]|jgi:ribose-phosphate pyrophosphokinase|nr:ribose-phosphate diphosphokinase [Treponema sp.]
MNSFVVTATRSMRGYAARVVSHLAKIPGFPGFSEDSNGVELLETERFADGEMEVTVGSSIRGREVILFSSSSRNEAGIGVEEAKIELYHTVDALKRSQAGRIIVFEPYISCSRSDRTTRRGSVGLWVHIKILASLGMDHLVTYQLHSDKSKSMADPAVCAVDDIPALNLLKRYLCDACIRDMATLQKEVRANWAFCSVDAGGEKLARGFADAFGAPLVVAHKQRNYARRNTIESINILSAEPVEGKTLWIVDDMIDTAGSVESLVRALEPLRPAEINIAAVHAVFSEPAGARLKEFVETGRLKRIIVTDTVCGACAMREQIPNLEIVPSAELSARIIRTITANHSMSKLMRRFDAEMYLKSPNLFNRQE